MHISGGFSEAINFPVLMFMETADDFREISDIPVKAGRKEHGSHLVRLHEAYRAFFHNFFTPENSLAWNSGR